MLRSSLTAVFLGMLTACPSPAPRAELHALVFQAEADPGEPLAGVTIRRGDAVLGVTDATGGLRVELRDPNGTLLQLTSACPAGHRPASELPPIMLRASAVAADGDSIVHRVACPPAQRDQVILVRASGPSPIAGVPVLLDGHEVARTDEAGVAHVAVSKAPTSSFRVELAAAAINPLIRPTQVAMDFVVGDSDGFVVMDQAFTFEEPPRPPRRGGRRIRRPQPATPTRPVPIRIGVRRR